MERFEQLDYIEDSARWSLTFGRIEGQEESTVLFTPVDEGWLGRMETPLVIEGRMFDPDRHDELVVDEAAAEYLGVSVDDRIPVTPFSADQPDLTGEPGGPRTLLRVVGVVRTSNQFLFTEGAYLSPGFLDRYRGKVAEALNGVVRLKGGAADSERLKQDASNVLAAGTTTLDLNQVARRVTTSTSVEGTALLLLALAVAGAGVAFVGQALSRSASVVTEDLAALRGAGFTRAQIATSAALSHILCAVVAATVAAIAAVVLSARFPIGLAREIDPDPGVHFDALVLVPGLVALPLLVLGAAWLLVRFRIRRNPWALGEGRIGLLAGVRRLAPLPVGLGTTMALVPGRGRTSLPVRPALLGAVTGILGVVAAVTLHHGLTDALDNPERVGVTWDAEVYAMDVDDAKTAQAAISDLKRRTTALPDVDEVTLLNRAVRPVDGSGVPLFALDHLKGGIEFQVLDGRAPASDDEAAVGPTTARQLDVGVGDTVRVGASRRQIQIVGRTLFPSEVHGGFDEGLWMTPGALAAEMEGEEGAFDTALLVGWRPGVDTEVAHARFGRAVSPFSQEYGPAVLPRSSPTCAR
ncbi:MAG: ABC transporter permease [Acidimicrobiales bacterium]